MHRYVEILAAHTDYNIPNNYTHGLYYFKFLHAFYKIGKTRKIGFIANLGREIQPIEHISRETGLLLSSFANLPLYMINSRTNAYEAIAQLSTFQRPALPSMVLCYLLGTFL